MKTTDTCRCLQGIEYMQKLHQEHIAYTKQLDAVEPDANSGKKEADGFVGCNNSCFHRSDILCPCPCHSKQAPNDHRMPQVKSSDERWDNPSCDCGTCVMDRKGIPLEGEHSEGFPCCFIAVPKLPKKMKWQHDNGKVGVSNEEIMHKVNEIIEHMTAMQKEG